MIAAPTQRQRQPKRRSGNEKQPRLPKKPLESLPVARIITEPAEPPEKRRPQEDEEVQEAAVSQEPKEYRRREKPPLDQLPELEDDDSPRRRRKRLRFQAGEWRGVHLGLTLLLATTVVAVVGVLLFFCLGIALVGILSGHARPDASPAGTLSAVGALALMTIIAGLVIVLDWVVALVGLGFCVTAPARNGAKALAIGTLAVVGLGLLLSIGSTVAGRMHPQTAPPLSPLDHPTASGRLLLDAVRGLLAVAGSVTFLLFLRAVAVCLREDGIVSSIHLLLGIIGAEVALGVLTQILVGTMGGSAPGSLPGGAILIVACVALLLGLIIAVWYLVLLLQVRAAVGRRL